MESGSVRSTELSLNCFRRQLKTFYFHRATMAACARNFRPELTVLLACESDSGNLITPAEIDATTVVRNELVSKLMLMPVGRK